jgi:glucan phosphorylase
MKMRNIKTPGVNKIPVEMWKILQAKNEGIEILMNLCNKPKREKNSRRNVKRQLYVHFPKAREKEVIVAVVDGFRYYVYGARFFTVFWLLD